jgi:hypothetical protein
MRILRHRQETRQASTIKNQLDMMLPNMVQPVVELFLSRGRSTGSTGSTGRGARGGDKPLPYDVRFAQAERYGDRESAFLHHIG